MAIEKSLYSQLDDLLKQTDLTDVSAESTNYSELPDGYYNCEVDKVDLKLSKTSGNPMVSFQFTITEDGYSVEVDEKQNATLIPIKKTKNRKIFMRRYWYMSSIKDIATDFSMKESNVKMTLLRMRNDLKSFLEKEGIDV